MIRTNEPIEIKILFSVAAPFYLAYAFIRLGMNPPQGIALAIFCGHLFARSFEPWFRDRMHFVRPSGAFARNVGNSREWSAKFGRIFIVGTAALFVSVVILAIPQHVFGNTILTPILALEIVLFPLWISVSGALVILASCVALWLAPFVRPLPEATTKEVDFETIRPLLDRLKGCLTILIFLGVLDQWYF